MDEKIDQKTPIIAPRVNSKLVQQETLNLDDRKLDADEADIDGGDESVNKMLTSREASRRVLDNNKNEPPPMTKKTVLGLITVYFSVFLDMMGLSLVQPVLPFYAEKFNANSFELGALYSSYSLMAAFASYMSGKASDKV